ncbi:MAG: glutaredoxin family protein [Actinomycetota bacterium]|nr:glutaredoxin family protein [Actinomycetota bacterium]
MRSAISPHVNATRSLEVVVVRAPACHLCEDAIETLDEIRARFPIDVRLVEIDSDEGRAIVARYHPALSPAVLIDGRLFSSGRLPRKKLLRALEQVN